MGLFDGGLGGGLGGTAMGFADPLNILGTKKGPTNTASNSNESLDQLGGQNQLYNQAGGQDTQRLLDSYLQNGGPASGYLDQANKKWAGNGELQTEFANALATGPLTGSKFATEQVQNNPILGGLYGSGGQLSQAEGKLADLQNQGYNLKPEDQSLYGQESGNIARQFGQQGNQAANNLAARGLSSSGAAGAQFSGLAGNQNEMLAQAQQQIAQQRFQNTNQMIGQYQNFVNSMGANANNAINQQYGRQETGAAAQKQGLLSNAQANATQNMGANASNLAAANFNVENKPGDYSTMMQGLVSGAGGSAAGAFGKGAGQAGASGLFGSAAMAAA